MDYCIQFLAVLGVQAETLFDKEIENGVRVDAYFSGELSVEDTITMD